jgi:hypothetical protein
VPVLAPVPVIDPVAVANVEALLAAIPPNGELHEAGEEGRERWIERTCVDLAGNAGNDIDTATWPVAADAIRMDGLEPSQDPGSVQEIVDQGIDSDQLHADFQPLGANVSGADQNAGEADSEHLVRDAIDIAQWLNQRIARSPDCVLGGVIVRLVQAVIDPGHKVEPKPAFNFLQPYFCVLSTD